MTRATAILVTLLAYKVTLILIGVWASRRTHDDGDFYLGGRKLGPWVAALSASASSSSAWTLLGVSGAAYAWGLSALWLFPATLMGFIINWFWVAPRLMPMSRESRSLTLTEFLAGDAKHPLYPTIMRFSSVAILFSFMFYIASQFQAAGHAFASSFGLPAATSIAIGAAIIVVYTLLGGFWAVSVTDTLQGMLMVIAAIFLPLLALVHAGGPA
ncbi:MAG: sodium/proline symporter, partial [Acidobacteria bacterium]|nr:sodium/proline symporter [Acidobacteriota bacterium]